MFRAKVLDRKRRQSRSRYSRTATEPKKSSKVTWPYSLSALVSAECGVIVSPPGEFFRPVPAQTSEGLPRSGKSADFGIA